MSDVQTMANLPSGSFLVHSPYLTPHRLVCTVDRIHPVARACCLPTLSDQADMAGLQDRSALYHSFNQTQPIHMESGLRFRFLGLALLLSTTLFTACKKTLVDPVAPADAATQSAGTYTYSALSYNGITIPADQTTLKGAIRIVRLTATTVSMNIDIRQRADGSEFVVGSLSSVNVTDSGGSKLSLTYQGDPIATVAGNKLTVESEDEKGVPFSLVATK